jgi:flagellar motor switch protein FliM
VSRLLTKEEIEALRAEPYIPAPRERFHVVVDAGHADLTPEEIDRLEPGDIIPLHRSSRHPVDIVANAVTIARGTLVEVDGRAAVRVTSLERRPRDRAAGSNERIP